MANLQSVVINWLETIVDGVPVSGQKPVDTPDEYILVSRTGGPREAMVLDRAEILIEVYDKNSNLAASNLADSIADAVVQLEAYDANITHASVNSVVDLDDTLTQYNRYQVYCDVYYRR
jgi:hypothetical protein